MKVWANVEKSKKKAEKFEDTVAVSFSLISEENEDLFVAVVNGELRVEPYHYDDYGCEIEASAETVNKLFAGEISFDKALKDGVAVVKGGDVAKFKALECLVPAKKSAAKDTDKKTAAKDADKKSAAKVAEKKTSAKVEEKKPSVKTEEKKAVSSAKAEEKKAVPASKSASAAAKPAAKK